MLDLLTMKFGGTSVGNAAAIAQVVDIISTTVRSEARQVVVVVSAMSGVTDLLMQGTMDAASQQPQCHHEIAKVLRKRHTETAQALLGDQAELTIHEIDEILNNYKHFCDSVHVIGEATPRALDYTMGLGEQMSVRLVASALQFKGVSAIPVSADNLIITDDRHQNATPLLDLTQVAIQTHLQALLNDGAVPVITGFVGATQDGITTTLGRGGSDYSAALIGTVLKSDEVWIWSDVDGVLSADPRLVAEATTIEKLSYREMAELAYFGAKVVHPKTIRPVIEAGIPLRVKNTFNPTHPGTLVLHQVTGNGALKAITAIREVSLVMVEGKGMMGVPGIAARTFRAVADTDTSVLLISQASSEQSICFAVPQNNAPAAAQAVETEFERELARRDIDHIRTRDAVTIITVVGAGVLETPGIAGQVFTATGQAGINVIAIAQGSSECGLSLVVEAQDTDRAVQAIHDLMLVNHL